MLEQYAETAYMGKQDAKFRDEIATDERDSMYCRYQSKQALFPRGSVLGHCFDSSQTLFYKDNLNGSAEDCRSLFEIDKKLKLAMNTIPANFIDFIISSWVVLHFINLWFIIFIPSVAFALGATTLALDFLLVLVVIWVISKVMSLMVLPFFRSKYNFTVNFNRLNGIVEVPSSNAKDFEVAPFEKFNAHYKVQNNPKSGYPYRGFSLLHYKYSMRYAKAYANQITPALIHWELLQNFMDVTKPLADIPQFEYYREFDKTTAEFDKANGRPKYFWYRVDKSFLKEMNQADDELRKEFNDEEQLNNLLTGKPIKKLTPPDIFKFPWKYADNIKAESEIKFGKTLWQKFISFLMVDL